MNIFSVTILSVTISTIKSNIRNLSKQLSFCIYNSVDSWFYIIKSNSSLMRIPFLIQVYKLVISTATRQFMGVIQSVEKTLCTFRVAIYRRHKYRWWCKPYAVCNRYFCGIIFSTFCCVPICTIKRKRQIFMWNITYTINLDSAFIVWLSMPIWCFKVINTARLAR